MAPQKRFNDPRKQFVDPYWTIISGVLSHGRGRSKIDPGSGRNASPVAEELGLNSNTIRRWRPCNLGLMCFYCTVNTIEKPCESGEINLRGIFPNVLRQDVLSKVSRRVTLAIGTKSLAAEIEILNFVSETVFYR